MKNLKKVLSSVLMFSFLLFSVSPLVVFATENNNNNNNDNQTQNQNDNQNHENDNDNENDQNNNRDRDHDDEEDNDKVNICHKTDSESNPWNAIQIDSSALSSHLDHGDFNYDGDTKDGKPDNKDKKADKWCGDNAPVVTVDVTVCKKDDQGNFLSGWMINLDWESNVHNHWDAKTGADGCAYFNGIHAHDYVVSEIDQPNWSLVSLPGEDGHIKAFSPKNGPYYIVNHYTPPTTPTATISAKKVVCDDESYLPNWGASGPDITSTTAIDYVANSEGKCHLADWTFEWGAMNVEIPDNNQSVGGAGWTTFTSTATVPAGASYWVREQTQAGYVPFSGATADFDNELSKFSAEIYCDQDVLNYDNYDYTRILEAGQTVHCVGFNAYTEKPLACNPEVNLLANGSFETPAVSTGGYGIFAEATPGLEWLVSWVTPIVEQIAGLEIQDNVAGAPALGSGDQFAELDGNHPVKISQDIPTIAGKEYKLSFKYSPRPGSESGTNMIEARADGNLLGAVLSGIGGAFTNWTSETRTFIADANTKIEFIDTDTDNSYGGYIDDVSLTCLGNPAPQCNAEASSVIVSDATTVVGEGNAVPVGFIHEAWTATIPGATWIWSDVNVVDATVETTKTFTKTFSVVGTPLNSELLVAADNSYDVLMNGVPVVGSGCSDITGATFASVQTCMIPASMMTTGTNTLAIAVKNWAVGGSDYKSNPAGLKYKFTLNNNECVTPPVVIAQCSDDGDNGDEEDNLIDANDPGCHTDGNVNNPESYDPKDNSESNESAQCSDGISNDNDGLIDSNDPGCMSGEGGSWNPADNDETDPVVEQPSSNNGGGGGSGNNPLITRQGQVLGAETSCGIYVDKFVRRGYQNDVEAVKKIQKFLNEYMKAGIKEDGNFGMSTEKWLKKFQIKHADKILTPWGFTAPTGIFYLTTQTAVNNIMCPELNLLIPVLTPFETNPLAPKRD